MTTNGYHDGYWNGESAKFRLILAKIHHQSQPKMHWQNAFVDTTRQVVEIIYGGRRFYIDNFYGLGIHKVTKGLGSPAQSHYAIGAFTFIKEISVSDSEDFNVSFMNIDQGIIDAWQAEHHPEDYKRSQNLKETLRLMREKNSRDAAHY
jgi:hypothetical protein